MNQLPYLSLASDTIYYGIGAVIAVGVIGGLGYYIYQTKKEQATTGRGGEVPNNPSKLLPQSNKFEM